MQHLCNYRNCCSQGVHVLFAGMRLADGMSKSAVAFLAKQLAAENTHTGKTPLPYQLSAKHKPFCGSQSYCLFAYLSC